MEQIKDYERAVRGFIYFDETSVDVKLIAVAVVRQPTSLRVVVAITIRLRSQTVSEDGSPTASVELPGVAIAVIMAELFKKGGD